MVTARIVTARIVIARRYRMKGPAVTSARVVTRSITLILGLSHERDVLRNIPARRGFITAPRAEPAVSTPLSIRVILEIAVAVRDSERTGSTYEFLAVDAAEIVDHFAYIP